jgi:hypothetical protein
VGEVMTVYSLMEKLDKYSMFTQYQVFPYSLSEIQSAVEVLDHRGLIDITEIPNIKKRITQSREFKFSPKLLVD